MKLLIFLLVIFSFVIRYLIFKLFKSIVLKHSIWTAFKWFLAILVLFEYKFQFSISFKSLTFGVLMFMLSIAYFSAVKFIFKSGFEKGLYEIYKIPLFLRISAGISAGFTEEIIYRGFLVLFFDGFLNNIVVSSFISLIIFGLFHIPLWGIKSSIFISIWSAMFYLYFIYKKELFALILAHSLNDIFFFTLSKKLIRSS